MLPVLVFVADSRVNFTLLTIKRRKVNWFGDILRRNCLLKCSRSKGKKARKKT